LLSATQESEATKGCMQTRPTRTMGGCSPSRHPTPSPVNKARPSCFAPQCCRRPHAQQGRTRIELAFQFDLATIGYPPSARFGLHQLSTKEPDFTFQTCANGTSGSLSETAGLHTGSRALCRRRCLSHRAWLWPVEPGRGRAADVMCQRRGATAVMAQLECGTEHRGEETT
jgi:hypothetical protein